MDWIKKNIVYIRNIYTSLFASILATSFSGVIFLAYSFTYEQNELFHQGAVTQGVMIALFPILIIVTAALVFSYFDNLDLYNKREYCDGKDKTLLIKKTPYLIGFAISMMFSTFVFSRGYIMMLALFFGKVDSLIPGVLSIATMAILRLTQLYLLQDKWQTELDNPLFAEKSMFKRNRDMYTFKPHQMILQPIGYAIVFTIAAYFAGYMAFPLFAVIFNIITHPEMWWTIFSIPVIIIVITYLGRAVYGIKKRKILIKKLKQMENEGLARVEYKGRRYVSSFLTVFPFSVKVTDREGVVYNCVVLTSGKINAPMYFTPDEYMVEHGMHFRGSALLSRGGAFARAVDISSWGGNKNPTNMIFGFRMKHKLRFPDTDGKPTVLFNPVSTTAFSLNGTMTKPVDTGEDMTKYTIYTASGFFNHIERQSRKGKRDYDY